MSRKESYSESLKSSENYNNSIMSTSISLQQKNPLVKINVILDNNDSRMLIVYKGEKIEDSIQRFFKENNFNKEIRKILKTELLKKITKEIQKCIFFLIFYSRKSKL
jgi:hypothetical protein